jgi:adenylate kinase
MKTICITGTPGTGKSTLAVKLSNKLGYPVLDVKNFIKKKKLAKSYDKKRKCDIVDEKLLSKEILNELKEVKKEHNPEGIIIDSHMSHYLPKSKVTLCIVTKASLKVISNRLKKRRYNKQKIKDNLEAEIFDTCYEEAKQLKHTILVIDTTKGIKISTVSPKVIKLTK